MTRDDLLLRVPALEQHLDTTGVDVWPIVVHEQIPLRSLSEVRSDWGSEWPAPVPSASPAAAGSRRGERGQEPHQIDTAGAPN